MLNVLILGSGGREHAFAWKISQSPLLGKLYVAPGNGGTSEIAQNVELSILDFNSIASFCLDKDIHILIPGSEDPLVEGISNYFTSRSDLNEVYVFGPTQEAARLEGSKAFAKAFMASANIPTAAYAEFNGEQMEDAESYLDKMTAPYVIKADGLAAGKGVLICQTRAEAGSALKEILLDEKFGKAGSKVVIEAFLSGIEFSVFAMSDGADYLILPEAKDYKRIGEGDTGLNTGGMGAVSPVPFFDTTLRRKVIDRIIEPTFKGMKEQGMPFTGFLFFGLISVQGEPYVIEYNVRMGDPETEVVLPRIQNDLLDLIEASRNKRLNNCSLVVDDRSCCTVFTVSQGYPGSYSKGSEIRIEPFEHVMCFHAGTVRDENRVLRTNGGRVLAVSALNDSFEIALELAYQGVEKVRFEGKNFRKDIGQDLLKLKQ